MESVLRVRNSWIVGIAEGGLLDLQRIGAMRERRAGLEQFLCRHREEPDLVEEPQQPGLAGGEGSGVVRQVFHIWMVRPNSW